MKVRESNEEIVSLLNKNDALLFPRIMNTRILIVGDIKHLIFRATPQWFMSMDKSALRKSIKDDIKNINWLPSWGEDRILI